MLTKGVLSPLKNISKRVSFCNRFTSYIHKTGSNVTGMNQEVAPPPTNIVSQVTLDIRQPVELRIHDRLKKSAVMQPGSLSGFYINELEDIMVTGGNPSSLLGVYVSYIKNEDNPSYAFLVRLLQVLGFCFDSNSFWSTEDKQIITSNKYFRYSIHDLISHRKIDPKDAPRILYALVCLEYRPPSLLSLLLPVICEYFESYRFEVLANMAYSIAMLNLSEIYIPESECEIGRGPIDPINRETINTGNSPSSLFIRLIKYTMERYGIEPSAGMSSDWACLAYSITLTGNYDIRYQIDPLSPEEYSLPRILYNSCEGQNMKEEQVPSIGSTAYWLYTTLYSVDVEKPDVEIQAKKAVPLGIQLQLHSLWLRNFLLPAQPQGVEWLQKDVDTVLRRTNTQSLINCSVGRPEDQQHVLFCSHKLNPGIALEYNHYLPNTVQLFLDRSLSNRERELSALKVVSNISRKLRKSRKSSLEVNNNNEVEGSIETFNSVTLLKSVLNLSGVVRHKTRLFKKMGLFSVVIHRHLWEKLSDDQKEEQILNMRNDLGYIHDKEFEMSTIRNERLKIYEKGKKKGVNIQ